MTIIQRKSFFRRSALLLLLVLLTPERAAGHEITVTVKDEMDFGVVSKIRHLKFKADDMCSEIYRQVGEVEKDGGPIHIQLDCKDSDWLIACPVGSIYRVTAESVPKHCRGQTVAFVFGFVKSVNIHFGFDSWAIAPNQMEVLREYADLIRRVPFQKVSVDGHTDQSGTMEYNMMLSLKRADAVRSALVAAGVPNEQTVVAGHGENQPVVPAMAGVPIAQNRRAEIGLLPIQ